MKFRSRSTNRWVEELMMRRWKQDWLSGNEGKWVNIWRVEHKRPPCRVCCMCVYYAWAVKKHKQSYTLSTLLTSLWLEAFIHVIVMQFAKTVTFHPKKFHTASIFSKLCIRCYYSWLFFHKVFPKKNIYAELSGFDF